MIFAATDPPIELDKGTQDALVGAIREVGKELVAGIPDATRAEPFTGLMLAGVILLVIILVCACGIICYFLWKVAMRVSEVITSVNDQQREAADKCHLAQKKSHDLAYAANVRSAVAVENNTRAFQELKEVIVTRAKQPGPTETL